jgi:hypothetical protein
VENWISLESESTGVIETVAWLRSCLPAVSTIVPLTVPEIFFCGKAWIAVSKKKLIKTKDFIR